MYCIYSFRILHVGQRACYNLHTRNAYIIKYIYVYCQVNIKIFSLKACGTVILIRLSCTT